MSRSLIVMAVLVLLASLIGCQAKKDDMITMQYPEEQKKIERIVHEMFDAARQKDFDKLESFHLKGPKFTKFDDWEPLSRQDAETAMKAERDGFTQVSDFNAEVQDFKADVFGDVAIATFVASYTMKAGPVQVSARARSTVVFVKDGNVWKITHEHFSPFKSNP
jgi:ketosteroid isomerase-like protein